MTQTILRIAYASRHAGVEGEEGVAEILEVSRRNNARDGVTGALLFGENVFVQVLEGPAEAVSAVFERIQLDPRHTEVVVLLCEQDEARRFGEWAMAYAGQDPSARARFRALDLAAMREREAGAAALLGLLDEAVGRGDAMARMA